MSELSTISARIAAQLSLSPRQVERVAELLDDGNTIPFITRYRKEATGGLDETQLRAVAQLLTELRAVAADRQKMLDALHEQGKLTDELRQQFEAAETRQRLDELYAPFRSRRKTKADAALEKGLGPVAEAVWTGRVGDRDLKRVAANCVGKHPELKTVEDVIDGTRDILAARVAESIAVRDAIRQFARETGQLTAKLVEASPEAQVFKDYAAFSSRVTKLAPHRVLALDRGEDRKALRVSIDWDLRVAIGKTVSALGFHQHAAERFLRTVIEDALKRLVHPAIERELRRGLTESAQIHAIEVFSRNLRQLLMQPPLQQLRVLAIDPGYRTGCKVAALGESGEVLGHDLIYVIGKDRESQEQRLAELVREHRVALIAIGNGTASRETQELVASTIGRFQLNCKFTIVNEAGASIYSASEVAAAEFPEFDATIRGTISIGRRLQDPLSELVKIDPQHVGVGMYQHDLSEQRLRESLGWVVESCVNQVGVDLNRASVELLKAVSGLNRKTAQQIVNWRAEHGSFRNRAALQQVPGIGTATFTQAAGFLKIVGGDEPLDATWIHPESYDLARRLLSQLNAEGIKLKSMIQTPEMPSLAKQLGTDLYTLEQLVDSLQKPGRDPREDLPGPFARSGVLSFADLTEGMRLQGVVTNVVDFGAFVDIGLKNDGLIHISKLSDSFVASPYDVIQIGDVVTVWVDQLDQERQRVGLSRLAVRG